MKRIQYSKYGGLEELQLVDTDQPQPAKGQVLVHVMAASVNPKDGKIRRGEMKMLSGSHFPRGLGHDFAGIVDAVGPDVDQFKPGDEVFGATVIKQASAFAQYVVAEAKNIWLKPSNVSFEEAAALTVVGVTAWNALVGKAKVKAGQSVFISGCLGGVGRAAVQIARMYGVSVVGSCSPSGREEALGLGVSKVVDYRSFDAGQFRRRFDVVFDTAGALSLSQCGTMLKKGGMSLHIVPTVAKMIGSVLSSRHYLVFGNQSPESLQGVAEAAGQGKLVPAFGRVVPLSAAISAIGDIETGGSPKGKLVIAPMQ